MILFLSLVTEDADEVAVSDDDQLIFPSDEVVGSMIIGVVTQSGVKYDTASYYNSLSLAVVVVVVVSYSVWVVDDRGVRYLCSNELLLSSMIFSWS